MEPNTSAICWLPSDKIISGFTTVPTVKSLGIGVNKQAIQLLNRKALATLPSSIAWVYIRVFNWIHEVDSALQWCDFHSKEKGKLIVCTFPTESVNTSVVYDLKRLLYPLFQLSNETDKSQLVKTMKSLDLSGKYMSDGTRRCDTFEEGHLSNIIAYALILINKANCKDDTKESIRFQLNALMNRLEWVK